MKITEHEMVSPKLPHHLAAKNGADPIRPLAMPVPDDCTDRYAAGWAFADTFLAKGGDVNADAPSDWHEEKVNGFWDRLAAEREVRAAGKAPACGIGSGSMKG